ncbi:unnamed protein product, partial [Protopolystoma xenopodis]
MSNGTASMSGGHLGPSGLHPAPSNGLHLLGSLGVPLGSVLGPGASYAPGLGYCGSFLNSPPAGPYSLGLSPGYSTTAPSIGAGVQPLPSQAAIASVDSTILPCSLASASCLVRQASMSPLQGGPVSTAQESGELGATGRLNNRMSSALAGTSGTLPSRFYPSQTGGLVSSAHLPTVGNGDVTSSLFMLRDRVTFVPGIGAGLTPVYACFHDDASLSQTTASSPNGLAGLPQTVCPSSGVRVDGGTGVGGDSEPLCGAGGSAGGLRNADCCSLDTETSSSRQS